MATSLAPPPRLGPLARRRRRRLRRWLAAGCVAAAGGVAVATLAPPAPPTSVVLLAARDLPVGAVLTAADVVTADVPAELAPSGALDAVDGAVLASPITRGEVVTRTRTTGSALLTGQPAGTVAAGVAVGDPALVGTLVAGTRVDVLALVQDPVTGASTAAERIATDVVVLQVPTAADGGLFGGTEAGASSVLVAVDAQEATRVAAAAGRTVVVVRS
jgi:pilus assembly protein CpaB